MIYQNVLFQRRPRDVLVTATPSPPIPHPLLPLVLPQKRPQKDSCWASSHQHAPTPSSRGIDSDYSSSLHKHHFAPSFALYCDIRPSNTPWNSTAIWGLRELYIPRGTAHFSLQGRNYRRHFRSTTARGDSLARLESPIRPARILRPVPA